MKIAVGFHISLFCSNEMWSRWKVHWRLILDFIVMFFSFLRWYRIRWEFTIYARNSRHRLSLTITDNNPIRSRRKPIDIDDRSWFQKVTIISLCRAQQLLSKSLALCSGDSAKWWWTESAKKNLFYFLFLFISHEDIGSLWSCRRVGKKQKERENEVEASPRTWSIATLTDTNLNNLAQTRSLAFLFKHQTCDAHAVCSESRHKTSLSRGERLLVGFFSFELSSLRWNEERDARKKIYRGAKYSDSPLS